jgi:acyl-CoA reductase-like NAD-dependent aldehyde dehydrogenase
LDLVDKIIEYKDELSWLESLSGKPITQAKYDIQSSIDIFTYYANLCNTIPEQKVFSSPQSGYTLRQPIGVVGLITSFNYPFLLLSYKLAPCLAAGNTVVIKPSPSTPLSCLFLAELTNQVGFPDGVVNVVLGHGDIGHHLVSHSKVKMISFTGSTKVGQSIGMECGKNLKPCTLELGGKNAAIVFDDVQIDEIAEIIVDGAFCI